ncbi:mismatch repair endonuclease PMS2 [Nematostella vectensis]|uniref:mismatch repair endonuclease PMS2 n=1 Tax=Nematostella vectensis TaxID=45351 RepID=UPI002076F98F|nr:mismatch repair endonuclease PMS2 [Nematostella vectensis]
MAANSENGREIEAPSVLPIDRKSVHQICSGQVVLNLATAMKELLENSLDAGATSVDVRLKEHGSHSIEVSDNGAGVEPQNFEALTLKHYTSKLKDFSDLSAVETFGFRGEALSSLCALSDLSITTRHISQTAGTKLDYDHNGKLKSKLPCAREQGTMVTVLNLFSTLPVRHKEFLRNIKKEFVKLVHVLQGYCLISAGTRITCSNHVSGRRSTVVSTHGSSQIKDNITAVFGPKQVQSLLPFKQLQPSEEDCTELNLSVVSNSESNPFTITGFISKADHGSGRSSSDRQFFFINKRPCDLPKVSRVVSEVYHMYNRHQSPFVMLDISLKRDAVDVNVTPDKRQVFLQQETLLLATLRTSLIKMFDPGTSTYEVNQKMFTQIKLLPSPTQASHFSLASGDSPSGNNAGASTSGGFHSNSLNSLHGNNNVSGLSVGKYEKTCVRQKNTLNSLSKFKRKFSELSPSGEKKQSEPVAKQARLTEIFCKNEDKEIIHSEFSGNFGSKIPGIIIEGDDEIGLSSAGQHEEQKERVHRGNKPTKVKEILLLKKDNKNDSLALESSSIFPVMQSDLKEESFHTRQNIQETREVTKMAERTTSSNKKAENITNTPSTGGTFSNDHEDLKVIFSRRKTVEVEFSMEKLRTCLHSLNTSITQNGKVRIFRAKISPENNSAAEEELTRNIQRGSFARMEIVGQFNLGFILAKLDNDLFIIDQHASDEKYNFEMQQRNTVLRNQRLIIPRKLELTAVNESILLDNLEIFRKNGFEFQIDDDAPATQKVKLVSVPTSKNWTFGVEDVEELIFMLSDAPGILCRPTRVRKMFASRACRMSIMVGTALSHAQMQGIVRHMGEMEHPWNCPHGRPTMRHVVNLAMLPSLSE